MPCSSRAVAFNVLLFLRILTGVAGAMGNCSLNGKSVACYRSAALFQCHMQHFSAGEYLPKRKTLRESARRKGERSSLSLPAACTFDLCDFHLSL